MGGRTRRAVVAALSVCALSASSLAACGTSTPSSAPPPGPGTSSTGAPNPVSGAPRSSQPADPAHAMPAPGPRTQPIRSADILVFRPDSLPPAMVQRILAIRGRHGGPAVQAHVQFGLAQAVIENQAVNLAAVDPATYRLWVPYPVDAAGQQQWTAEWDRVAGGEAAVTHQLDRKLTDFAGYLPTSARSDAPRVHIGGIGPQIPQVDAVVNSTWGAALHMTADNALLLSTGGTSPQSIRRQISRIVGKQASVQLMDIATTRGLDPTATQAAVLVGSTAQAVGTFTYAVGAGGRIIPNAAWVSAHISTEDMPIIGAMTCNTAIFPQLRAALDEVVQRGLASKIHPGQYEGCFYPKYIEGTHVLSNHAFGLAFDLNVPENQRGTPGLMDRTVVSIFEKWGFDWGGNWHYTDPMHFEANRIVSPR